MSEFRVLKPFQRVKSEVITPGPGQPVSVVNTTTTYSVNDVITAPDHKEYTTSTTTLYIMLGGTWDDEAYDTTEVEVQLVS